MSLESLVSSFLTRDTDTISSTNMDFDEPSVKAVKEEFIAVVLAGFGNEYVSNAYELWSMIE